MKKMLRYLVAAVLFSFSIVGYAGDVSSELANKVLAEGEPTASGYTGFEQYKCSFMQMALRYRGQIYVCQITLAYEERNRVRAMCFDYR